QADAFMWGGSPSEVLGLLFLRRRDRRSVMPCVVATGAPLGSCGGVLVLGTAGRQEEHGEPGWTADGGGGMGGVLERGGRRCFLGDRAFARVRQCRARHRRWYGGWAGSLVLAVWVTPAVASTTPKHVLILDSFGRGSRTFRWISSCQTLAPALRRPYA